MEDEKGHREVGDPQGGTAGGKILDKRKILRFLRRDQGKLLNPQIRPFSSVNQAYDSLLPYHLFKLPTYEDLIYMRVKRKEKDLSRVIESMAEIVLGEEREVDELRIVEERLKVEEERYFLGKTLDYKNNKAKVVEEMIEREAGRSQR
jgi:Conserved region of unknown function on GLTSCR protein